MPTNFGQCYVKHMYIRYGYLGINVKTISQEFFKPLRKCRQDVRSY